MDSNIKRYCELILEINEYNKYLDAERDGFYYGGYSFEECHSHHISELNKLETEFIDLVKKIIK
jgi:hypothetical protein